MRLCCAQRRPGREPRRHVSTRRRTSCASVSLNEGRGANPGDTRPYPRRQTLTDARSTKAGARTPATRGGRHDRVERDPRRSTKAGARTPATPVRIPAWIPVSEPAQRRPGREPRRHVPDRRSAAGSEPRSTKAGARTPATPGSGAASARIVTGAQRRPGREPRRHRGGRGEELVEAARSTKAGARTPATRRDAGYLIRDILAAQRRPGREPRRHAKSLGSTARACVAQRRPGREPRRHWPRCACRAGPARSLNEGRGANPGDTSTRSRPGSTRWPLNEGRGANPGDTGPPR